MKAAATLLALVGAVTGQTFAQEATYVQDGVGSRYLPELAQQGVSVLSTRYGTVLSSGITKTGSGYTPGFVSGSVGYGSSGFSYPTGSSSYATGVTYSNLGSFTNPAYGGYPVSTGGYVSGIPSTGGYVTGIPSTAGYVTGIPSSFGYPTGYNYGSTSYSPFGSTSAYSPYGSYSPYTSGFGLSSFGSVGSPYGYSTSSYGSYPYAGLSGYPSAFGSFGGYPTSSYYSGSTGFASPSFPATTTAPPASPTQPSPSSGGFLEG